MKRPDKYFYPAVFTYDDNFEIAVTFPDLPGCATSGKDDVEALTMAREALSLHLWSMEDDNEDIPLPTPLKEIKLDENEVAVLVDVYMPSIRLAQINRAVNRTVTLPAWLNAIALENNINFSATLQEAIKDQLHLK